LQLYEVELGYFAQKAIKKLQKTCPSIEQDLKPILSSLEHNPNVGEPAKGSSDPQRSLRKVRVPCSDLRRGKRQSYRILHKTIGETVCVLFIFFREEGYPSQKLIQEALQEFT